jgi:cell division protein FtsB
MSETVDQLRAVIAKLHDRLESVEKENDRLSRELAIERG